MTEPAYWEVEVRVNGERILTIGRDELSGVSDIERHAGIVRTCAEHLASFIGPEDTPPCFLCGGSEVELVNGGSGNVLELPCPICCEAESDQAEQTTADAMRAYAERLRQDHGRNCQAAATFDRMAARQKTAGGTE